MKNLFIILLIVITGLYSQNCYSQNDVGDSLDLARDRSFNFYFVNGYALGYKYSLSGTTFLKLILDFKGSYLDRQETETHNSIEYTNISDNLDLAFYGAWCYELYKNNYINIFLGIGPYYGLNYYSTKYLHFSNDSLNLVDRSFYRSTYNTIGIFSVFGVEGFINSNVSLIAETHLTGLRRWEVMYGENTRSERGIEYYRNSGGTKRNSWYASINFVRLGIGIYF